MLLFHGRFASPVPLKPLLQTASPNPKPLDSQIVPHPAPQVDVPDRAGEAHQQRAHVHLQAGTCWGPPRLRFSSLSPIRP